MPSPSRWLLPEVESAHADLIRKRLRLTNVAAQVLVSRGFTDPDEARKFLFPVLDDLISPDLLLGMDKAVARIRQAIAGGEKILIYGDYDVDGITSVVILKKALEMAGGTASFHVPHRLSEGYGMRPEVIEKAAADGARLVISVDTGIRGAEVVRHAAELGIDVIITDHHLPESELPPALAVLNPNQPGCSYPDKNLCGVGVTFKLVQSLFSTLGWPEQKVRRMLDSFLKLVAIGTVADVVPLTGENRVIVKHGLAGLRTVKNPGLRALMELAGFTADVAPSPGQVAFRLAPRMNAAGRMASANDAIELLLTGDHDRARALAEQLHALNADRQQAEAAIVRTITEECVRTPITAEDYALVFAGEDWHRGVLGIVAGRLMEMFHRPAIVLSRSPDDAVFQGSGRSIPRFHLLEALETMPELFVRFGGHMYAVGLALDPSRLDEFRMRLNEYARNCLTPEDLVPEVPIDACVTLEQITEKSVAEVLSFAPFGQGNRAPILAMFDAEVAAPPVVWKEKHLRVTLRQNGRSLTLKAWNFAPRAADFAPGSRVDVAFILEDDPYSAARGYPGWAAVLRDVRPADATGSQ